METPHPEYVPQIALSEHENFRHGEDCQIPEMLKAWELDPHYRNSTRAIPMMDYISVPPLGVSPLSIHSPCGFDISLPDKKGEVFNFRDSYSTIVDFEEFAKCAEGSCPDRPLHLNCTHFRLRIIDNSDMELIIRTINHCLESFHEFDFSFLPGLSMWKGKYLQGCSSCCLRIHLFCERPSSISPASTSPADIQYIIEVKRISGDARPFYEFFKEFKSLILAMGGTSLSGVTSVATLTQPSCEDASPYSRFDFVSEDSLSTMPSSSSHLTMLTSPTKVYSSTTGISKSFSTSLLPSLSPHPNLASSYSVNSLASAAPCASQFIPSVPTPSRIFSAEEFISTLKPIFEMARTPLIETQLEAARIIWDISAHDQTLLGDPICVKHISEALEHLIVYSTFHAVREQALVTLARFMDLPGYTIHFAQSPVVAVLRNYVSNPKDDGRAYDSAQLRRECAYSLASLVSCNANHVLQQLLQKQANQAMIPNSEVDHFTPATQRDNLESNEYEKKRSAVTYLEEYRTITPPPPVPPAISTRVTSHTNLSMVPSVTKWLSTFDDLKDPRLRSQAIRIRDGLSRAINKIEHESSMAKFNSNAM